MIAVDIHHPESEGFFSSSIAVTNLDVMFLHCDYFKQKVLDEVIVPVIS